MKVRRKQIVLFINLFIFSLIVVHVSSDQTKFKESRNIALPPETILDERCYPVLSTNGKVGFITSVTTGSVMSFNTTSGRVMSSIIVGETVGAVSLVETDSRRLLAVAAANDPDQDKPVSIAILDATKPKELQIVTLIVLPKTAHITPSTRVSLTPDARLGVIASSFPEPTLYSFSIESGQIISQLAIIGQPSEIALRGVGSNNLIAISSAAANSLSFINLDNKGWLKQISFFSPDKAQIGESNNPEISFTGRIAYIAANEGGVLFSIDTVTGALINSLKISPAPQRISLTRNSNREELLAITRTRNNADKEVGGVLIVTSLRGQLSERANFEPPAQIEFSQVNNVVFSDDAMTAFIGSKSGMLFSFSTESGELKSHQPLGSELLNIAINSVNKKIIAIKRNLSRDEIIILDFEIIGGNELDDKQLKMANQVNQNLTTDSMEGTGSNNNNPSGEIAGSKGSPKVFMQDSSGNRIAVESSRVRFRSNKTLEIALDGNLAELIERGGWKFNVREHQPDNVIVTNKNDLIKINRAFIKPSKNANGNLRLRIIGENFKVGNLVEFIKSGTVIYKQNPDIENEGEITVKLSENKYSSFGQFSVRVINSNTNISNLIEVEPLIRTFSTVEPNGSTSEKVDKSLESIADIDSVTAKSIGNGLQVTVKTQSQFQYKDFTLNNPNRIVIDMIGVQTGFRFKTLKVNSPLISRIRVGRPSTGVVRIVLDSITSIPYKISRNDGTLTILAGNDTINP